MLDLTATRRARLADERGFTMIVAMMVMLVILLLSATAYAAVNGDIRLGLKSNKQKLAYAAAEAGLAAYQFQLNTDGNFWQRCDGKVSGAYASDWTTKWVNQPLSATATADTRTWQTMTGSTAQYTAELLPNSGYSTCDPSNPQSSMFDTSTGTFRLRFTGRADSDPKTERSIVATFKRAGFLDYIYYTDKEDQSPKLYSKLNGYGGTPSSATGYPTQYATSSSSGTLENWAAGYTNSSGTAVTGQCTKYWRNGRGNISYPGTVTVGGTAYTYPAVCGELVFGTGENIKGPFHTNDSIYVCGTPVFGRSSDDAIEISDPSASTATRGNSANGCTNNATYTGTQKIGAALLKMPPTNAAIKADATISLTGATKLTFNSNGTVTAITNKLGTSAGTTTTTYTLATNNVIYVSSRCTPGDYDVFDPKVYGGSTGATDLAMCGDVSISGTYTKNVTVASDNDIVITDDVTRPSSGDAMLGLVANGFVRVAHDASWSSSGTSSCATQLCANLVNRVPANQRSAVYPPACSNNNLLTQNVTIQAAILAVNGSFTVDKYWCGTGLGTLNVVGAIAQGYRGTVGISGGASGFAKNYSYDDRLQSRTPPKFLDPVNTAWSVARQIEQAPATGLNLPPG